MSRTPSDSALPSATDRLLALGARVPVEPGDDGSALGAQLALNPLFADLPEDGYAQLVACMDILELPAGLTFIQEGDAGDFLVFVMRGSVDVVRRASRGEPVRVAQAGAGQSLGEMSLFDDAPRFASCVTLEACRVAVLDRVAVHELLTTHPALGNRLLLSLVRLLSERLRQTGARLIGGSDTPREAEAPPATTG